MKSLREELAGILVKELYPRTLLELQLLEGEAARAILDESGDTDCPANTIVVHGLVADEDEMNHCVFNVKLIEGTLLKDFATETAATVLHYLKEADKDERRV